MFYFGNIIVAYFVIYSKSIYLLIYIKRLLPKTKGFQLPYLDDREFMLNIFHYIEHR